MQIQKTQPSDTSTVVVISAEAAELEPIKNEVIKKLAPNVKLAGFRSGKVPLKLVEKNLDSNILQSEVLEQAVSRLYSQALRQEDIRPVEQPQVNIKKYVPYTTLEFEAIITVVGKLTMPDYKSLDLPKPKISVTQKDVSEVIQALQKRAALRTTVERPVKDSDEVTIDFLGKDKDGKTINGASGDAYPLIIGSDSFIPGFEKKLIGLKAAQETTFTIPFPVDYSVTALRGKKVTFEVTVKSVAELTQATADDDFAAKVGPFKNMEELKKDIKIQITNERQQESDRAYENELLKQLASKTDVAIPDVMIDEQIEKIEKDELQNLLYRGQTFEEHLKQEGVTPEEHRSQKRPAAEERVKMGLLLSEVADREKFTVTPQEFDQRIQQLRLQHKDQQSQDELAKPAVQRDIIAQLLTEKTLACLVNYANKQS